MLDAGGGGGNGGTNWMTKNVIEMWQAIENQDTTPHYQALTGWQKSADLLLDHQRQVQNYRNSLAAAWPPERSPAAAAYLARLDTLIKSLQETYDAAVANHDTFGSATASISVSRQKIKQIYDEYTANQAKLDEFHAQPPHGGLQKTAAAKPPVPDGRQEQLNNEARSVMFSLSGAIIQARGQLRTPMEYLPEKPRGGGGEKDNSQQYVPPALPAVTPYDPGGSSSTTRSTTSSHSATTPASRSVDVPSPSVSAGRQPGLILGGTQVPISPGPTTAAVPPSVGPTGGGSPAAMPSPLPVLPPSPTGPPMGERPPISGVNGAPMGRGVTRPMTGAVPGEIHAMPPGGVIGALPGTGLAQPAAGSRSTARVNPVGGVIQPNSQGRGPSTMGRATASGQLLGGVGRRSSGKGELDAVHWDPNDPWVTAEGVSPVLMPPLEQRVDPGPAIGLH
jgi:hypothetical protein